MRYNKLLYSDHTDTVKPRKVRTEIIEGKYFEKPKGESLAVKELSKRTD